MTQQPTQVQQKPDLCFLGNVMIYFYIFCRTGLHIGCPNEGCEIGGMDNPLIKNPLTGYPYIPGSTLKGKSRMLLEWEKGPNFKKENDQWKAGPCDCGKCDVCKVFGTAADKTISTIGPTRIIFEDFFPTEDTIKMWKKILGPNINTEIKVENTIDRLTSIAMPRNIERVPADSEFEGKCIYRVLCKKDLDSFKVFFKGLNMIADNFIGGGGTRGNGCVTFKKFKITWRGKDYYEGKSKETQYPSNNNLDSIKFDDIKTWLLQQIVGDVKAEKEGPKS